MTGNGVPESANGQLCFFEVPVGDKPVMGEVTRKINPNNLGYSKHPLFAVYHGMRNRCHNPNQENYRFYGARGISVCEEWMSGITAFLHDMESSWPGHGYEIDRIDVNGDYCKKNCRWIKKSENIARSNRSRIGMRYKIKYRA